MGFSCNRKQNVLEWRHRARTQPIYDTLLFFYSWMPVVVVWLGVLWAYVSYIGGLLAASVCHDILRIGLLVPYIILFILFAMSMIRAIWTRPATIPAEWRPPAQFISLIEELSDEVVNLEPKKDQKNEYVKGLIEQRRKFLIGFIDDNGLPSNTCDENNSPNYCNFCRLLKPDRTHHCKICNRCVPRYDHHCPWLNACIHNRNYKFFILTLIYATTISVYSIITSAYFLACFIGYNIFTTTMKPSDIFCHGSRYDAESWRVVFRANLLAVNVVLMGITPVSVVSLLKFHFWLLTHNETTIEQMKTLHFIKNDQRRFDRGSKMRNAKSVLGSNPLFWPLPVSYGLEGENPFNQLVNLESKKDCKKLPPPPPATQPKKDGRIGTV